MYAHAYGNIRLMWAPFSLSWRATIFKEPKNKQRKKRNVMKYQDDLYSQISPFFVIHLLPFLHPFLLLMLNQPPPFTFWGKGVAFISFCKFIYIYSLVFLLFYGLPVEGWHIFLDLEGPLIVKDFFLVILIKAFDSILWSAYFELIFSDL